MPANLTRAAPAADLDRARADLDRLGYCIVPGVLPRAEIAALKGRLVEQAAGERARGVAFRDGGPGLKAPVTVLGLGDLTGWLAGNDKVASSSAGLTKTDGIDGP